ncbi:hypothetical protein FOXB_17066 [Fusarium oxysporum f. sp. conglutinans Fo5176]|uniref:Uncharacterized protein n=1 Tax=Fusarium oxysporum (strain Fo5176) TaxID=660025 RepID=F9GEI2_FUSOF|nr:hypothetical protein FOXB_17066 [Fusarium oxysporum f. sp. conglutinans Fo5176]
MYSPLTWYASMGAKWQASLRTTPCLSTQQYW